MFQPTIYQANNPETLPVSLSEPEIVTETELPDRLQTINSSITTLENKTQAITYDMDNNKTIITDTTETGNLKVTYDIDTYTLSVGDSSVFTGSVTFQSTVNGYNIENEFSKLQYLSTMDDVTEVSGIFRASNLVGITYDADLNTTFFSGNLSSPNISAMSNNLSGIIYNPDDGTGSPLTEFTHSVTIDGNITADNLTGISYNSNLLLQSTDYTTATVLNNHLHVDLTNLTYKPYLGIRAHKDNLASGQEMMIQVGKSHSRAISFVYKANDIIDNSQYRLDFAGRNAYVCTFGATKTEHEIKGNLTVFGTVTDNASKTITHYTKYEGEMKPGCFVESTGKIYRDPASKLSPYEDCISIVKLSTEYNNNIIGVCTEIINEEIKDDYGNIIQPAGNYCKYATHGDVLIKCVSATYSLGDILIPTTGGYAKKANNMEIIDAMTHMIPRLKVTSVETEIIDSETVCAFISL